MLKGKVRNNSGRGKHIFKRNVPPGTTVSLKYLYDLYKSKYGGAFDLKFVEWLKENKIKEGSGFEVIVDKVVDASGSVEVSADDTVQNEPASVDAITEDLSRILPSHLTSRQIADLKIKDNPKKIIPGVMSVHKLRRALTMCKGRPGKETLIRLIKERIDEIH